MATKQYPTINTRLKLTWHLNLNATALNIPAIVHKVIREGVLLKREGDVSHPVKKSHFKATKEGWDLYDASGVHVASYAWLRADDQQ